MNITTKKRVYGFIITRHVNTENTNKYWNLCIQCIRKFYNNKIVVIDDNSNPHFIKEEYPYKNVEYVQSEYVGRGELLPYYYFFKNHYFDRAVIIHDSVFFQKKIRFDKLKGPVLPIWHFEHERFENPHNSVRLINDMNHHDSLSSLLFDRDRYTILFMNNSQWVGCFGCQCYIDYAFVVFLQKEYNLFSLLKYVRNRRDRCCLERIMGILFYVNNPGMHSQNIYSILGCISKYMKWGYTYDEYNSQHEATIMSLPLVKVWTGR
jgi:hypothetical protein